MAPLTSPEPARLSKRGSITPSVRRLLTRYPPAIINDTPPLPTPPATPPIEQIATPPLSPSPFERRFPKGYKVADVSIPLYPDEVPSGYESLFNPEYRPISRTLFFFGFICPLIWAVCGGMVIYRRIGLNGIIDPRMYWTRVQWLKLNTKYGLWSAVAFVVLLLLTAVIVMVVKAYGG